MKGVTAQPMAFSLIPCPFYHFVAHVPLGEGDLSRVQFPPPTGEGRAVTVSFPSLLLFFSPLLFSPLVSSSFLSDFAAQKVAFQRDKTYLVNLIPARLGGKSGYAQTVAAQAFHLPARLAALSD